MGTCLLGGLVGSGHPSKHLWISHPSADKLSQLQHRFSVHTTTENTAAAEHADVLLLAVKPLVLPTILHELKAIIQRKQPLIISIAAGATTTSIEKCLDTSASIVRAMPNIPSILGCGASALFANAHSTSAQQQCAESILRAVGAVVWIEKEGLMDAVTALSGSGPAYFFSVMEAMQNAGVALGLPPNVARLLTLETALGAAKMALETDTALNDLCTQVTSPGGTTEKALHVLAEANLQTIFSDALKAANQRAQELGKMIAQQLES